MLPAPVTTEKPELCAPAEAVERLVFTGAGDEYFRIWVFNLLFNLMTLGVYSPWAKVRKVKYFRNNTHLAGHVFDYHANPVAILRGRIVAVMLFAAYSWGFSFSKPAGIAALVILCVAGPWLVMRSLQFSLGNTSHRGLRFGFRARTGEAYRALLPIVLLWFGPTLATAIYAEGWALLLPTLVMPTVPWMHYRLKKYQHGNATYGDRYFAFRAGPARFYGVYFRTAALGMLAFVVLTTVAVGATTIDLAGLGIALPSEAIFLAAGLIAGAGVYVVLVPFFVTRVQQLVWNHTRLDNVDFTTDIRFARLLRLAAVNIGLTLLTCGIYWPWAAVAFARYRIECIRLHSGAQLEQIVAGVECGPVSALGEGVADTFGFDFGL